MKSKLEIKYNQISSSSTDIRVSNTLNKTQDLHDNLINLHRDHLSEAKFPKYKAYITTTPISQHLFRETNKIKNVLNISNTILQSQKEEERAIQAINLEENEITYHHFSLSNNKTK